MSPDNSYVVITVEEDHQDEKLNFINFTIHYISKPCWACQSLIEFEVKLRSFGLTKVESETKPKYRGFGVLFLFKINISFYILRMSETLIIKD